MAVVQTRPPHILSRNSTTPSSLVLRDCYLNSTSIVSGERWPQRDVWYKREREWEREGEWKQGRIAWFFRENKHHATITTDTITVVTIITSAYTAAITTSGSPTKKNNEPSDHSAGQDNVTCRRRIQRGPIHDYYGNDN